MACTALVTNVLSSDSTLSRMCCATSSRISGNSSGVKQTCVQRSVTYHPRYERRLAFKLAPCKKAPLRVRAL